MHNWLKPSRVYISTLLWKRRRCQVNGAVHQNGSTFLEHFLTRCVCRPRAFCTLGLVFSSVFCPGTNRLCHAPSLSLATHRQHYCTEVIKCFINTILITGPKEVSLTKSLGRRQQLTVCVCACVSVRSCRQEVNRKHPLRLHQMTNYWCQWQGQCGRHNVRVWSRVGV